MSRSENRAPAGAIAYKLLRLRPDGKLGSLFVGRDLVITPGVRYRAQADLPHPGLAHRPGFHCTARPEAPHIKMRLRNGEVRVWCEIEMWGAVPHKRPAAQGGLWFTADSMRVRRIITDRI